MLSKSAVLFVSLKRYLESLSLKTCHEVAKMIINSKAVSLTEASTMLGMTETEFLRLCQYSYLEQSKLEDGKTRIIFNSLGSTLLEAELPFRMSLSLLKSV